MYTVDLKRCLARNVLNTLITILNKSELCILQKLQNRAMRLILQCNRRTHIKLMLNTLSFMSVKQRILYNTIMFVFKIRAKMLPNYLYSRVTYVRDKHGYQTRQTDDFYVHFRKTNFSQNNLFFKGLNLFNSLPAQIKEVENIGLFRRLVSDYVKGL